MDKIRRQKKVKSVMQELGNQVSPATETERVSRNPRGAGRKPVPIERRQKVADLHYKGFLNEEIAKKLGITPKEVSDDMRVINSVVERYLARSIEFHRKKQRKRLSMVLKAGWNLHDETKSDSIKVSALRVIISEEELRAKVDGIIAEKVAGDIEKKSEALLTKLATISKNQDGNGHKDVEVKEVTNG